MGVLDFLKKKEEQPKTETDLILDGHESGEIIIPDHAKVEKKDETVNEMFTEKKNTKNLFRVTKIYDMGIQVMLSGFVTSGKLKKKLKATVNKKELVIDDVKIGFDHVTELNAPEEGTLFVKTKQLPVIKVDDVLEFK
jgi:hypothetical protein